MSSGFNTDIRVGEQVFHVQTEDRGPTRPFIDTAVYQNGRVLHRRSASYEDFKADPAFSPEALRQRVEQQHRTVIEDLRSGALRADAVAAAEQPGRADAIQVQLLNPHTWLSAGNVSLDVEIVRRTDRQPQPGIEVRASIEGALHDVLHTGTTDDQGRARIRFPLPPLGKGALALVIQAAANGTQDQIRFEMRARQESPQPVPPPSTSQ
jgi:hypothetical protein